MHKLKYLITTISLIWSSAVMALEEPKYTIINKTDDYEIRKYEDRLAVETTEGNGEDRAFSLLFKYISGANELSSKVAMTIPVTQSTKIDMTAPVTQEEVNGDRVMRFFLPTKFTMEDAPRPTSDAVRLVIVKGQTYAVARYSGRSSEQNFIRNARELSEALKRDGVKTSDDPIKATFNGPFMPFFLRRNEVMVPVN
jgi:hypothetical protein